VLHRRITTAKNNRGAPIDNLAVRELSWLSPSGSD
jgi:hypothetical protein